ncbi:MAG: thioredoxin-like domain-containing protein [Bythopirellula sp.]|nr:thioredoxin-like domain-containing protein [Bythopirellula sp.]
MSFRSLSLFVVASVTVLAMSPAVQAAPSVADALKLTPVQQGIDYDTPTAEEIAKSSIKAEKVNNVTAWVVRGPENETLRQFADSNADNVVDVWSYYRDGLEVYRDIDSNNNGKADQYRWFHSDGIRWALDENEDNTIDAWRLISPEEVAEEVVAALSTKDAKRFQRLLVTAEDIKGLGLDQVRSEQLVKRLSGAAEKFTGVAAEPAVSAAFKFSDFGGTKPGMVPAGSQGVTKDIQVYENVWAMVKVGEEDKQLQLGTLISVKGAWKLIDGPTLGTGQEVAGAFFFDPGGSGMGERGTVEAEAAPTEEMEEWMADIQELDKQLSAATPEAKPALNEQRAEILLKVAKSFSEVSEREQWFKQLADSVSAAAQEGSFPDGIAYLESLETELAGKESEDLLAYFEFHRMSAKYYGETLRASGVDFAKAQEEWIKSLDAFVAAHPKSEHAPEALRQMAMCTENAGQLEEAKKWYSRILADYPKHIAAGHAKGAINRLTSEGREIALQAKDLDGGAIDLKNLRGKVVVIQYWTTTSDVCVADHAVLKELVSKYGGKSLDIISINLDYTRAAVADYLASNRLPWKQVYDEGGFDGRLASEMGVVTVPLILLVGPDGKVISSNIQAAEIEAELKKLDPNRLQSAARPAGSLPN